MLKDSLATSLSSVSSIYVSITSTTVNLAGTWLGRKSSVQAHPQDKENVLAMSDLFRKLLYRNWSALVSVSSKASRVEQLRVYLARLGVSARQGVVAHQSR